MWIVLSSSMLILVLKERCQEKRKHNGHINDKTFEEENFRDLLGSFKYLHGFAKYKQKQLSYIEIRKFSWFIENLQKPQKFSPSDKLALESFLVYGICIACVLYGYL